MSTSLMIRGSTAREAENLLVPALRNCINCQELKMIHANVVKLSLTQSSFLVTKMVDVCDNLGDVNYAVSLFQQVVDRNVFLYNAVIRSHARTHSYGPAVALYKQMLAERHVSPDEFTLPFVLKSCAGLACDSLGSQVHAQALRFGLKSHYMIDNALMDVYVKCGNMTNAHKLFDETRFRDVVCWNNLLSGYARAGQMWKARAVFDEMPKKSIVSWTAMISGYTGIGRFSEALEVFREMQGLGVEPDEISVVSVLPACAQLGALEIGKWIHFYSNKNGLSRSMSVSNALIEMYAKCGCIDQALQLFDRMTRRDIISWSTMIAGLANHGKAREAIAVFRDMERSSVVEPNRITFLGLLSACVHGGLWQEGLEYFKSMKNYYHLEPQVEHYGCLVDLLGRSGLLERALETIEEMPMKPDSKIWGSLLNSSRVHCNLEIALVAMEHLSELESDDIGNYVLLSNIYADLGSWDEVAKIRKMMRSKSVKKIPGCSSIEIDSAVEEFTAGDYSKSYANDLFSMLGLLVSNQNLSAEDLIKIIPEDHSV